MLKKASIESLITIYLLYSLPSIAENQQNNELANKQNFSSELIYIQDYENDHKIEQVFEERNERIEKIHQDLKVINQLLNECAELIEHQQDDIDAIDKNLKKTCKKVKRGHKYISQIKRLDMKSTFWCLWPFCWLRPTH